MKRQEIPILFHDILNPIVSDEGYDLNAVAVVYMISMKEGQYHSGRALWHMSVGDAMKVCSQPRTQGIGNWNAHWMLCWTTHKINSYEFVEDDGRFEKLLIELA
jgi:hypothetical protein